MLEKKNFFTKFKVIKIKIYKIKKLKIKARNLLNIDADDATILNDPTPTPKTACTMNTRVPASPVRQQRSNNPKNRNMRFDDQYLWNFPCILVHVYIEIFFLKRFYRLILN